MDATRKIAADMYEQDILTFYRKKEVHFCWGNLLKECPRHNEGILWAAFLSLCLNSQEIRSRRI